MLAAGAVADISIVDPARVADLATFEHPQRASRGIQAVFVSGQLVWNGTRPTGARPGRLLGRGGVPIATR